jgi:beta-lactamase regulating signal transducer with metallopeptidase domain
MVLFAAMILPVRLSLNVSLPSFLKQLAPISPSVSAVQSDIGTVVPSTAAWGILDYAFLIWLIGAVCFLGWHLFRHIRFMSMVRRWSENVTDSDILMTFNDVKNELGVGSNIKLMTCACIKTPMMIGFLSPTVLLPRFEIPSDELHSILKHELIHLKRHDLWFKALMLITLSLHWYNPIVHLMLKLAMDLCEISCDECVLKGANEKSRAHYGEAIIGVIRNGGMTTSLSTNFFTSIEGVKSRVYAIMDTGNKRFSPVLMMSVICISLLCMTAFAITPEAVALQPETVSRDAVYTTNNFASNEQLTDFDENDINVNFAETQDEEASEATFKSPQLVIDYEGIIPEEEQDTKDSPQLVIVDEDILSEYIANPSENSESSISEEPRLVRSD